MMLYCASFVVDSCI